MNSQRGFSLLLLLVGFVITIFFGIIAFFLYSTFGHLIPRPLPKVTPKPSTQVSESERDKGTQLYIYTISNNNLEQLEVFDNLETTNLFDIQPPIGGPEGFIFINTPHEIIQYNLDKNEKSNKLTAENGYLFDWIAYQAPDLLFASEVPANFYGTGLNPPITIEKNLNTGDERRIFAVERLINGTVKYLFKASTGEDIIGTFNIDGCKRNGVIYRVKENNPQEIVKTGGDCNRDPVYIGNYPKKDALVMMGYAGEWKGDSNNDTFDQYFLQNVIEKEKKTPLLDLKGRKKPITSVVYNPDLNKVATFDNDELNVLDVETAKQVGPVKLNVDVDSFYSWRANYGLGYFHETREIWTVEVSSGDVKKYQLPSQFDSNITPYMAGTWKGQPLISILKRP